MLLKIIEFELYWCWEIQVSYCLCMANLQESMGVSFGKIKSVLGVRKSVVNDQIR